MKNIAIALFIVLLGLVPGVATTEGMDDFYSLMPVFARVANADGPILHEVYVNGERFLADQNGTLLHIMEPPVVYVFLECKKFFIQSSPYYSPGTTYYNNPYDGFNVSCGCHPRATPCNVIEITFGPDAGEMEIPGNGEIGEFQSYCIFNSFVVDGIGKRFESDKLTIYFERDL